MRNSAPAKCWLAALMFTLLPVACLSWYELAAQDPAKGKEDPDKKPSNKEEFDKKPLKPPPRDDDEPEPASKVPAPVGDDSGSKRSRPAKPGPLKLTELAREADRVELRSFYESLAVPQDTVYPSMGNILHVEPIVQFIGEGEGRETLEVRPMKNDGTLLPARQVKVRKVEHYEQSALRRVDEFLATRPSGLPRLEMLQAAAKALDAVIQFHEAARAHEDRLGKAWEGPAKALEARLQSIQLERLEVLKEAKDWPAATKWAEELGEKYPEEPKVELAVIKLQLVQAQDSLKADDFVAARLSLERMEKRLRNDEQEVQAEKLRGQLAREAEKYFKQAQEAIKANKRAEAKELLARAESIWPRLAGLRDERLRLDNTYPILRVGVRHVPRNFWPGTERTDADRQAVELLFESLVRPRFDALKGQSYEAELAADRPRVVPLGREFQLVPDAFWSDGKQVTAVDVLRTVQLLKEQRWPGHTPEWADLVEDPRVAGRDPFRISLTLRQGYLDPLSLMSFKILPAARLKRVEELKLAAANPVGSGPLQYKETVIDAGRGERVVFEANPNYRRAGKLGLPRIREIHFIQSNDPRADLMAEPRRLDLLLDLSTAEAQALQADEALKDRLTFQTLPNRRIYFLAVNHRRTIQHLDDVKLRRAIALAIDRDQVLDTYFRDGLKVHRALTGPFPTGSWACKPKAAKIFQPTKAKNMAKEACPTPVKLSLLYPNDELRAKQACEYIATQVNQLCPNLQIEPQQLSPEELYNKVEILHDYDLAYYHWDYPSEDYWLWPLLDPRKDAMGIGGRNFLGFNDGDLGKHFRIAMAHREFKVVQGEMHEIHEQFVEKMPFIPLWQLDTHIIFARDLQPVGVDPLLVFTDVEEWRLEKR